MDEKFVSSLKYLQKDLLLDRDVFKHIPQTDPDHRR